MTLEEKALNHKPFTSREKRVILSLLNNGYLDPIKTADEIREEVKTMADRGDNILKVSAYLNSFGLEDDLHYFFISNIEIRIF